MAKRRLELVPEPPMSTEPVEVYPEAGLMRDTARALLNAAESLGHRPEVVEAVFGGFVVPPDVAAATVWPNVPTYDGRSSDAPPAQALAMGAIPARPLVADAGS